MSMKEKKFFAILIVTSFIFVISFSSNAKESDSLLEESYGKKIQKYLERSDNEEVSMSKSLELCENNTIVLPQKEINMAKDFYVSAGSDKKDAEGLAVEYVKEVNSLYQEAIKNGYTATDEEIKEHLELLKKEIDIAENKEEIYVFINTFDNEQDYWDFQFEMFKKDLPIQKYIAAKEQAFLDKCIKNNSKKTEARKVDATAVLEYQDEWDKQFLNMKENVVNKYDFLVE